MLHNEPVDILAIASARKHYWANTLHYANMMQYSEGAQRAWDGAWAEYSLAASDLEAAQALISELVRA